MNDPLYRLLAGLPQATPDEHRAARVRLACHAALARRRPQPAPRRRAPSRIWEAVLAGLCGVYLMEIVRLVLNLYGIVRL